MTKPSSSGFYLGLLADILGTVVILSLLPLAYLILVSVGVLARLFPRPPAPALPAPARPPGSGSSYRPPASIVIPNWNGSDLLRKYLPSVIAACDLALGDEIIVVDNASEDGSAALVAASFPQVRLLPLDANRGFGGGSNAGIDAAHNDHVVLLNSDMRVEPGFLAPLLAPFEDPMVFAVAAQILFSDPGKRREESGLTYARWHAGEIALGHNLNCDGTGALPCFYPGGGSSAFHRPKLQAVKSFDHLFRPFYLEDTDLGWEAWKRGWKVLYQPASVVYHEHRGTIGKRFSVDYVNRIIQKNRVLFHWKHLEHPGRLAAHALRLAVDCIVSLFDRSQATRCTGRAALRALAQLPEATIRRWNSTRAAVVSDSEALLRHRPDVYHDRFAHIYRPDARLQVLFLSPYPIYPPHHGGAVLMSQTLEQLSRLCDVHLVVLLEAGEEREAHESLRSKFASMHLMVRPPAPASNRFGLLPHAVREFANHELQEALERIIFEKAIDVVQVEYTNMAQYARSYKSVLTALFEHDVYFQSIARRLTAPGAAFQPAELVEYLRAIRYELNAISSVDYVQVCTSENAAYLKGFAPWLGEHIDPALRAGIDTVSNAYNESGRDGDTLLFVGNFRHKPNQEGLHWLLENVMPGVLQARPSTRLRVVGPNSHLLTLPSVLPDWLDLRGAVDDVRPHLQHCAVFVCPVLTGSGVRVKLLEAFSTGIPVIATRIGAEGLAEGETAVCRVADRPQDFIAATAALLEDPEEGRRLARAARRMVESEWDVEENTRRLVGRYHELLQNKQGASGRSRTSAPAPSLRLRHRSAIHTHGDADGREHITHQSTGGSEPV